ncbi:MAG: N-acetylmuramoyl-L-alanine amidase [Candidatus Bipolaricaulota bacterium]|nr:N-acetylmuramoyl-L-alanine amidase [Candidatus Bipolaricaulota bacterium]
MTRCCGAARWPLLLVICLAVALGLPGCATSKSPGAVVREFFGLMSSGRYEAASQLLTADAKAFFTFGVSLAVLGSQFTGGKLGSMPAGTIEITREVIHGDTAEVEGTFRYADGTVEPMGFNTLVKENGQWKIALDLFGTGVGSSGSSPTPSMSSTSQAAPHPASSPTTAPGTSSALPNVSTQAGSQVSQTPGDVARQFFVLTSHGDYEAATALMTDEAKMLFAFGAFLTTGLPGQAGEEAGFKPIARVEITREAVQGDAAEVECTLHYADGSVDPVGSVALARVDGQWKIALDASGSGRQSVSGPSTQATPSKPSTLPQSAGLSQLGSGAPAASATPPPFIVAIDAGHGGSDLGAMSGDLAEKTINLTIVKRVVALLASDPQMRAVETRPGDANVSPDDRIRIAEGTNASIYVSIHINSFSQNDVAGIETWVDTSRKDSDRSWVLATMVEDSVTASTGARNRGIRSQASYTEQTTLPAVTIEVGYITNSEERTRLVDAAYQDKVAAGVVAGLRQFLKWRAASPSAVVPASANTTLAGTRAAGADLPEGAVARLGLGTVTAMRYSPDGRWIAVATSMGVEMRRSDTLALEKLLGGHAATTVAFSADGKTLASGSEDAAIRVWDATTGQLLLTLSGHTQEVSSIAFSPDGSTIASGSWDKTIKLWDSITGSLLHTLSGHTGPIYSVAFSGDGNVLASSGPLDKAIRLWATGSGALIRSLSADFDSPVVFSPDGKMLTSKSPDGKVMMWDAALGTPVRTLEGSTYGPSSLAFSPSGALIASGTGETVKLWDAVNGTLLRTLAGHADSVWIVKFSPDGQTLASGSDDKTIRLWDAATGALLHTITSPTGSIVPVGFSSDGKRLGSFSTDGRVELWDVATGGLLQTAAGYTAGVWSVAFSPDGKTLASGSYDKTIALWDASTGRQLSTLAGHADLVHSVAFSSDGKLLASGSYDNTIKVWDAATGTLLRTLSGNTAQVLSVAFSPDGRTLASATYDGTVRVWDVGAGTLLRTFLETQLAGSTYSVAFSPDGRILASGAQYLGITLWDTVTWAVLRTVPQEGANYHAIAFSPDGKTLASGGTQTILDVATGSALCTFFGHTDIVFCVAFSPDGKTLASASADCTVKLWDAATGALIRTLLGHTLRVDSVAFSPDGRTLASGSHDGTILLWDIGGIIGN